MFFSRAKQGAMKSGARTGVLRRQGGKDLETPTFIISTKRGAVPHLTGDVSPVVPVAGVYLEDLYDAEGPLEALTKRQALPLKSELVLLCARAPHGQPLTNKPNSDSCMAINTVQGSRLAPIAELARMTHSLNPDLVLVPFDHPAFGSDQHVGSNRRRKMVRRSLSWLQQYADMKLKMGDEFELLAETPPAIAQVGEWTDLKLKLATNFNNDFNMNLNTYEFVDALEQIGNGADLVLVPLTKYADEGKALTLNFSGTTPFLMDLNSEKYATDMSMLGTSNYAKAYIHHLLNAGEMTAQVLLQIHNLEIVANLFAEVRDSIKAGTFETKLSGFVAAYGPASSPALSPA